MTTTEVYETACFADIGGREEQQDRVATFERDDSRLLALADGVGGHEGGALAAQAAVDAAGELFHESNAETADEVRSLLLDIVKAAHDRINALAAQRELSPASTPHSTCVLLHLSDTYAAWAHVGDSRLYRFANGRFKERTLDHSVVELMRLRGKITEEEMKTHPDQNRLCGALGGEAAPEPDVGSKDAEKDDGFLLASDGLWENVSDQELEAVFAAADLSDTLQRLILQAKANAGPSCDNISVAAARHRQATPSPMVRLLRRAGRLAG